ncbi:hypothetical protein [Paenibacillus sp. Soil750]|uniref:hypothetical protein n=1 Tax=Paenibacillus sp. Soil750 TaxID=1736398 RepID=UPI0006F21DFB|nr:hypothetical protein [Paenibacillus sp. Soil750]KRE59713.1 hypothetical protein ASL11_26175 [Paenibacillus sp. Soil750]
MNRNKAMISIIVIILLITFFPIKWLFEQNKSLYDQIEHVITAKDSDFKELLHIHADRKRTLAFYTTNKSELCVVLLKKKLYGYSWGAYINRSSMFVGRELSWQGSESQESDIHLLYGVVENPEITQILVISEGSQPAHIIKKGENAIWYYLAESSLKSPITIQASNKNGKTLYETGSAEFWKQPISHINPQIAYPSSL